MSEFQEGNFLTRTCGSSSLATKQYYIVKTHTDGTVILAAAATDDILGVLANAPVVGDSADVANINGTGSFKVILGGNVTKGAYLTTDGSGKAIATTSAGNRVFGRALADGSSGDIVEYAKYNERYA